MDLSPVHQVSILAFLIGIVFGAVVNKTNFCTMGAVSDWVNMGDKDRFRAWMLAIGLAIVLSQAMQAYGLIELNQAIYLTTQFRLAGIPARRALVRHWNDTRLRLWAAHPGSAWGG